MKVGDYVRTKFGIGKLELIEDNSRILVDRQGSVMSLPLNSDMIIKICAEPIDLIEEGDYVNGKKVIKVWEEPFGEFAGQIFIMLDGEEAAPTIREIKSIVTKEQFESMEYKVVE